MAAPQVLLYFSGDLAAGAVARGGRLDDVIVRRREAGGDLADAVDELLTLLRQRSPRTWVITSDVWSQPVAVPLNVAERVPKQHLAQFLGFEVEPLSGIPAAEAHTAVHNVTDQGTDRLFWVTQTERGQFERVAETVGHFGGRLLGMFHPAGAPRPLGRAPSPGGTWKRIEVWNDLVLGIGGNGKGEADRLFFTGDTADALQHAEQWLETGRSSAIEILSGQGGAPSVAATSTATRFGISEEREIQALLQAWAEVLPRKAQAPLLVPGRQAMPERTRRFVAVGLAALALIACIGHWRIMETANQLHADLLLQEINTLSVPTQHAKSLKSDIEKLDTKLRETGSQVTKLDQELENYRHRMTALKQRVPQLLKTLADSSDEALLVRRIDNDGSRMTIHGSCLHPQQANVLAESLARELAPLGFSVTLPGTEARYMLSDGGPHNFTLEIHDKR